jgi:putative ABC transport system permease protein
VYILIIACFNFINLTITHSLKRGKEIGLRKVNGGKRSQIIWQFFGESLVLCFIAFTVAILIVPSWFAIHRWLQTFAYRTELSWWIFVLAGFLTLGVALVTVSWQSLKAATSNPIEALRYE